MTNILKTKLISSGFMTQENFQTGWIKVFRSVTRHWLWSKNKPLTQMEAWILILLETNYSDEKMNIDGNIVICQRGEKYYSLDTWARLFNWDKSKVRRFFELLKRDSMIELIPCKETTHLKVCNYAIYQDVRNSNDTQTTFEQHQLKNERNKELNTVEKPAIVIEVFDFKKSLIELGVEPSIADDWLKVRKTKKATNTKTAFNRIKNEIEKSGLPANECISISVEKSWQGFNHEWILNMKSQFGSHKPKDNLIRR